MKVSLKEVLAMIERARARLGGLESDVVRRRGNIIFGFGELRQIQILIERSKKEP